MEQNIKNNSDAVPATRANVMPPLVATTNLTTLRGFYASGNAIGFTSQAMALRRQG